MRQSITDLYGLLNEQKGILEEMLRLSQEEQRIIIDGNSELLEDIIRAELKELSKLNAIEKKRMALHEKISGEFGLSEKGLNVSTIAERAETGEREAITRMQTKLTELISRHTALNIENRELISAHLEYSDVMINLFVDSEDPLNNFYGGDGKAAIEKKKTTGLFDSRA